MKLKLWSKSGESLSSRSPGERPRKSKTYISWEDIDMKGKKGLYWIITLTLFTAVLSGCTFRSVPQPTAIYSTPTDEPAPTGVPTDEAPPPTETSLPPTATPLGPCQITSTGETTVYFRPSTTANVFSTMSSGMQVEISQKTADGWLGFDPGVAQAANVGVFRMRWVQESSPIEIQGDCGSIPVVEGPEPGLVYLMPMADVNVYAEPSTTSQVLATLNVDDYCQIVARSNIEWSKVDLSEGNKGLDVIGWIQNEDLNINGDYQALPELDMADTGSREEQVEQAIEDYWANISEGDYQAAWAGTTDSFKARKHNSDINDYINGYLAMEICSVQVTVLDILDIDADSALVMARVVYRNHAGCAATEFIFDHQMVYDDQDGWLLEKVTVHGY